MPNFWGLYIVTFVFWIGVAHAGALISAFLRIAGSEWKSTVTRIAEVITLFTLPAAASFPLIHLGRTGLFFYIIPYPNERGIWPNFKSPLVWDFFAISTYFTGSVLFLYVTLVPDLGIARPHMTGWKRYLYSILSWGWRGTAEEWKRVKEAAALFSVLILPVVISVHTIVSWDFAMQFVPLWHSEVFGPLFFVGALFSGVAAVVTVMSLLYWFVPEFKDLISPVHYDMMGRLWLTLSLAYSYLYFNDFIPSYYIHEPGYMNSTYYMSFHAPYMYVLWPMVFTNFVIPVFTLGFKHLRQNIPVMFGVSILVNIGMYIERVILFIPGLTTWNDLVRNVSDYKISFTEFSIILATFAAVISGYTLFCRVFPILPIWELHETKNRYTQREVAGFNQPYFMSGE
ncbi:MAG: NrfD/PsrC family molybdoenzyme membrane anchor subunit, partial [Candidatus Xenobia bacterium]